MQPSIKPSMLRASILFLLLFAAPALSAPLLAGGSADGIRVKVELDFGPADRKKVKKAVVLKAGATVTDATRAVAELKQGFVCCDAKDVESIDGVKCDPKKQGWWLYEVNGKKGNLPARRFQLRDGDRLVWRYRVLKKVEAGRSRS